MVAIGFFVVWLVLGLAGAWLTVRMIGRVWKRRSRASAVAWVAALLLGFGVAVGSFGAVIGLVKVLGAVGGESVDPSQKARILAEGISAAMNCTAFGVLLWIPGMIVALVLTRKRKQRSE